MGHRREATLSTIIHHLRGIKPPVRSRPPKPQPAHSSTPVPIPIDPLPGPTCTLHAAPPRWCARCTAQQEQYNTRTSIVAMPLRPGAATDAAPRARCPLPRASLESISILPARGLLAHTIPFASWCARTNRKPNSSSAAQQRAGSMMCSIQAMMTRAPCGLIRMNGSK